mmetsp:Transcript_4979/g.12223  ORF Transcript_4979/g.12223 Transcript_4979/m.12223 type:complete len:412 (+) Transcript_4979:1470-2705(+)
MFTAPHALTRVHLTSPRNTITALPPTAQPHLRLLHSRTPSPPASPSAGAQPPRSRRLARAHPDVEVQHRVVVVGPRAGRRGGGRSLRRLRRAHNVVERGAHRQHHVLPAVLHHAVVAAPAPAAAAAAGAAALPLGPPSPSRRGQLVAGHDQDVGRALRAHQRPRRAQHAVRRHQALGRGRAAQLGGAVRARRGGQQARQLRAVLVHGRHDAGGGLLRQQLGAARLGDERGHGGGRVRVVRLVVVAVHGAVAVAVAVAVGAVACCAGGVHACGVGAVCCVCMVVDGPRLQLPQRLHRAQLGAQVQHGLEQHARGRLVLLHVLVQQQHDAEQVKQGGGRLVDGDDRGRALPAQHAAHARQHIGCVTQAAVNVGHAWVHCMPSWLPLVSACCPPEHMVLLGVVAAVVAVVHGAW